MRKLTIVLLILMSQTVSATKTEMILNFFPDSLETNFWKYFISHVDNADMLISSPDLLKSVSDKLNEYFPGLRLGCLMTFTGEKKISQVYITAFGDKSKFPTIVNLVKKSPKTEKYNIIAFAPPAILQDSLNFNGLTIWTDNIEFSYKKNNNELDIRLFFPDRPARSSEFDYALQTLLFEFLGEVEFTKIGFVDISGLDKKPSGQRTDKLKDLYTVITTELK